MKKFIYTIIALLGILMPNTAWAAEDDASREAYAVLVMSSAEDGKDGSATDAYLTLYYDDKKAEHTEGIVVALDNLTGSSEIRQARQSLQSVIFDESFADCRPTSTAGWFTDCIQLREIVGLNYLRTDEVTDMRSMFFECKTLTSLDLSGLNTNKVTNMSNMFHECNSLARLDLSSFNTENVTDMQGIFSSCKSLTNLDLRGFNTMNVTDMSYMFYCCNSLKDLDLSAFNTENVKNMERMFLECFALTSLDLSAFNTGNVTTMENMFYGCNSLINIDLSTFNTENVTNMDGMFRECSALTSLDLSAFNTGKVTYMSGMFLDCRSLTNLNLGSLNTENVTTISSMFANCESMTSLDLSGLNTVKVYDMGDVFSRCYSLKNIFVSDKWTVANVTSGDNMFLECTSLVGGNGTEYNSEHTDYTYARIDTERAPGYFTDIADKGKEKMEQVETPYWNFEEDSLVLYNITEGATIYYEMKSWETQEQADSLANGMTVDTSSNVYSKAIAVEDNFVLKMFAAKEGMENSNDTTFIYNYKIWKQLQEVVKYGDDILYKAKESGKVDSLLLMELDEGIMDGYRMYHHRAFVSADQAQVVIENLSRVIKQVEEQLYATSEQVATPIFKFADNLLELFTETIDAKIYYAIQEFDNNLETDTIAKYARNLQVSVDSIEYKGQIEANFDFILKAMAVKEGMEDSEEATLIYPFTEWQNMLQTIDIGNAVFSMILDAEHSDEVAKLIEDVQMRMAEVESVYNNSRTEWDRETVRNEREYLKSMIDVIHNMWQDELSQKTTAKYENHILTVEGDVSMAQALEQVGGRNVVAKDIAAIVWNSSEAITRSDIEGFGNPNMLIYVQTDSIAPEGVNNVVIDGKAKSIILVDADSTNNNFYAPQAFVAESIQYTREFKQTTEKDVSRGWEGICLPFTVQKFTHESHGEIAPFGNDASIFHFWLHQMTDKGMANATTIEANKPYIISMPNNGSYPEAYNQAGKVTFSAENATVPVSDNTAIWSADGTIGMMSTYLRIEPSEHFYALNVGNAMEGYAEGSVFVQNLRDVKPFEVYTFHEPSRNEGAGARFISVSSLFGGEGTTGIIDIMKAIEPNGETWYDMNGRRLQSKPSRKGVYIMNGKKVVVK